MKRRTSLIVTICILSSVALIGGLKMNSRNPYRKVNNFNRNVSKNFISNSKFIDIKYNSYYIAGLSQEKIFLGNSTAPGHILVSDYELEDTLSMSLKNPKNYRMIWRYGRVYIDFPDIYLVENKSHSVMLGKFPRLELTENYNLDSTWFDRLVPISKDAFALRKFDTVSRVNTLAIKKNNLPHQIITNASILKKQVDGKFCTDGMLLYSPQASRLIYLYYYRNQIICLDTNLNVVYNARTIDTVTTANIQLDTIHSEGRITFSKPPLRVNKKSCLSGANLFVHSNLISNNEDSELFKNSSVIDVYELKNGKYKLSFYIPQLKGNKMNDFKVFDQKLIVIYDHYLATFDVVF